jgi:hypothetical protein
MKGELEQLLVHLELLNDFLSEIKRIDYSVCVEESLSNKTKNIPVLLLLIFSKFSHRKFIFLLSFTLKLM